MQIKWGSVADTNALTENSILIGVNPPYGEFKGPLKQYAKVINTPTGKLNSEFKGLIDTDGVSPSGTGSHRFSWQQSAGSNLVDLNLFINFPIAGAGVSEFRIGLPEECPLPYLMDNLIMADDIICAGAATMMIDYKTGYTAQVLLVANPAGDGYDILVTGTVGDYEKVNLSIRYFALILTNSSS